MQEDTQALQTQLINIQTKTGKSLEELYGLVQKSGLAKHGQIRDMLKQELKIGHGDANTLTTFYLKSLDNVSAEKSQQSDNMLDNIYKGAKADLRPIHDKLMVEINKFGSFEVAPKKTYVSLRLKKQFAMIGPATNTRIDVGINDKDLESTPRLVSMPVGSMCPFKVSITNINEADSELLNWLKQSFLKAD